MAPENPQRVRERVQHHTDVSLWFALLFLLGFGLVMIYSASSYTAFADYGDQMYYLKRQAISVGVGLIAMLIVAHIPYRFFAKFYVIGIFVSAVLIILVLSPLGVSSHGARRWIKIANGFNLQPAEVAKVAVILFMAVMIARLGSKVKQWQAIIVLFAPPVVLAGMIYAITDNLSSAIIVGAIACLMFFVARPDYKIFILITLLAVVLAAGLVTYVKNSDGSSGGGFRMGRIRVWLDPESDPDDKGFQTLQALYAIGSGGVKGKGLGQSMQKLSFLPESQNDMIFSIICEELGLLGAASIMLMFTILIWRMIIIGNNAPDLFGGMLVTGVVTHIAVQAVLNIAVVTNTVPNTGISLPFISYGGSSVIFLLIEMGMVLSVARGIEYRG